LNKAGIALKSGLKSAVNDAKVNKTRRKLDENLTKTAHISSKYALVASPESWPIVTRSDRCHVASTGGITICAIGPENHCGRNAELMGPISPVEIDFCREFFHDTSSIWPE